LNGLYTRTHRGNEENFTVQGPIIQSISMKFNGRCGKSVETKKENEIKGEKLLDIRRSDIFDRTQRRIQGETKLR
jgi:hypothetical protein